MSVPDDLSANELPSGGNTPTIDPSVSLPNRRAGSAIVSVQSDTNIKKGQSDAGGDNLALSAVLRKGTPRDNWVVASDATLYSDPRSGANQSLKLLAYDGHIGAREQSDTAQISATVGREKQLGPHIDAGVYATAGIQNGAAYQALVGLRDKLHSIGGMARGRRSPTTTGEAAIARVSARLDADVVSLKHGNLEAQLVATAGLNVGTDRREALAAGYVWLGQNTGDLFHPALPGMPAPDNRGTGVYAGIRAEGKQYDVTTHVQGTKPLHFTPEIGAMIDLGKALLSVSVSKESELVHSQKVPTTAKARIGLTIPFK